MSSFFNSFRLNVFSSDTMIKYSNYVSQPNSDDIIKSTFATSSQILNLQRHVQLDLEKEKTSKFKLLEKLRVEEEVRTENYLKDKLAKDIDLLKKQYEEDLAVEKEKIKHTFQNIEQKLDSFYVSEECAVAELANSLIKDNGIVLNNIMQNSTKDEILQSESVGQLLLFGWHLQQLDLINDATTIIAKNIKDHYKLTWFKYLDKPIIVDSANKSLKNTIKETTLLSLILMKSSEMDIYQIYIDSQKIGCDITLKNIFHNEFNSRMHSYLKMVESFSLTRLMDEYLYLNNQISILKNENASPTNSNLSNSFSFNSNKVKYMIPQINNAALSGKLLAALEKCDKYFIHLLFRVQNFKYSDMKLLHYDYSGPIACEARLEVLLNLMQTREPFWQSTRFPSDTYYFYILFFIFRQSNLRIKDGNNIELLTPHKYATLHSTVLLNSKNGGKFYYEATIKNLDLGYSTVCLGWDVPRTSLDKVVPGFTVCAENWVGLSGFFILVFYF